MAVVKQHKVVASLPDPLEADSIYYVRAGDGVDVYVTNGAGMVVAYPVNVGGGGLTLFTESASTAAPNNTVPANSLAPVSAAANVDFVVAPKGTGAILAQVPDGTTSGGNKRGPYSVDLQLSRGAASQVASGNYSFLAGYGNTASGFYSFAAGRLNTASGSQSACFGGENIADALYSVTIGRLLNTRQTIAAIAEGFSSSSGATQSRRIPLSGTTTNATPRTLTSNGSSSSAFNNVAILPDNSAYDCTVRVIARNTATNECKRWTGTALIKRGVNAATTTIVGSSVTSDFGDAAMSGCAVALSADTGFGALSVVVTGLASTTISWSARLETVESA